MREHYRINHEDSPYRKLLDSYVCVGRTHRMILERQLNKTGVYRGQHQLLMFIADNPNISQKDIARLNYVSTATVAVSLKKLEQGGYVRRVVDDKDNRYNQICITSRGQDVVEASRRFFKEIEQCIFEGFAPGELRQLQGYLDRMQQNLGRCHIVMEPTEDPAESEGQP